MICYPLLPLKFRDRRAPGGVGDCLLHLYNNRPSVGPTPPAGGLQKQQKQSTLGAEQRVPSFCLAWMGNQGRPQEVVARRKRGTPGLGMEGAKASRLAPQASAMWLQGSCLGGAGMIPPRPLPLPSTRVWLLGVLH